MDTVQQRPHIARAEWAKGKRVPWTTVPVVALREAIAFRYKTQALVLVNGRLFRGSLECRCRAVDAGFDE